LAVARHCKFRRSMTSRSLIMRRRRSLASLLALAAWMVASDGVARDQAPGPPPQVSASSGRFEDALQNVLTLERAGQDAYATIWDGNKFVQCRRLIDRSLRCESAGARMQPSLTHVLTPDRVSRLNALGWSPEPHFGGFVQTFPATTTPGQVADRVLQALADGYGARLDALEVATDWIDSQPCPPRNGPSQNLAGMVNDSKAMASTSVGACAYLPEPDAPTRAASIDALIAREGPKLSAEIQRLRINSHRDVFAAFDTGIGYVQCRPETDPPALYCEAQSADSWAALASVLTPERIARLHAIGFQDPGRGPNYWKSYPIAPGGDAHIAAEILIVLHDVYGYGGATKLEVATERDPAE
jgi:hypothetical protein